MKERQPLQPCFDFYEREQLYDQLSHTRFMALVMQPDIDIHEVQEAVNSFGEYLFVTVSCRAELAKRLVTFWGLGYHDHRERWIMDTWQWYESQRQAEKLPVLSKEDAYTQIKEREVFVKAQADPTPQSRRAQLYELLADLTDDDGALNEVDDWEWISEDDMY